MRRWTLRILVALCGLTVLAAIAGTAYQWLATRKDLTSTPRPGRLVDLGGYSHLDLRNTDTLFGIDWAAGRNRGIRVVMPMELSSK